MSQSGRAALALAVILAVGLLVGALMLRENQKPGQGKEALYDATSETLVDVRAERRSTRTDGEDRSTAFNDRRKTTASRERTSGVVTIPVIAPEVLPPLTGYVVDSFASWTGFPSGYSADGLVVTDGKLTLEGDPDSTAARSGVLVSPPLALRAPALDGSVRDNQPLPEAAQVQLEICLSEDGRSWSTWVALERNRRRDGNLVSGSMQPSLANAETDAADSRNHNEPVAGPSIRYRLHLSASGVKSPSVEDVRIWKWEFQ